MNWKHDIGLMVNQGKFAEAQTAMSGLDSSQKEDPHFGFMQAVIWLNQNIAKKDRELEHKAIKHLISLTQPPTPLYPSAFKMLAQYYYNLNDIDKAIMYYNQAVEHTPNNINLIQTLGDIYFKVQKFKAGFLLWQSYAQLPLPADHPNLITAKSQMASFAFESGNIDLAESLVAEVLAINNNYPLVIGVKGAILLKKGQPRQALGFIARAWRGDRNNGQLLLKRLEIYNQLGKRNLINGLIYSNLGNANISAKILKNNWQSAIEQGWDIDFANMIARSLKRGGISKSMIITILDVLCQKDYLEALEQTITLYKQNYETDIELILCELHLRVAKDEFDLANDIIRTITPLQLAMLTQGQTISLNRNQAKLARKQNNMNLATEFYDGVFAVAPNDTVTYYDRAAYLNENLRYGASLAVYDHLKNLSPNTKEIYSSLNYILGCINLNAQAIKIMPEFAYQGDSTLAHRNLAISLLSLSRYEEGFKEYEWRWKIKNDGNRLAISTREMLPFTVPQTLEEIRGKSIMLYMEQGMGDNIHFMRYVKPLSEIASKITILINDAYAGLSDLIRLRSNLYAIIEVEFKNQDIVINRHDLQASLMDLPKIFKSTIDNVAPIWPWIIPIEIYQQFSDHLFQRNKRKAVTGLKKIGFVYEGGVQNPSNKRRSLGLKGFLPILLNHDAEFICLQKDIQDNDRIILEGLENVTLVDDLLTSFLDTAAIIEQLDLVISVDTSVIHMAGNQNIPSWLMVTWRNDWRWGLRKCTSPWYPSLKIYHQPKLSDWEGLIFLINADLRDYLAKDREQNQKKNMLWQ